MTYKQKEEEKLQIYKLVHIVILCLTALLKLSAAASAVAGNY